MQSPLAHPVEGGSKPKIISVHRSTRYSVDAGVQTDCWSNESGAESADTVNEGHKEHPVRDNVCLIQNSVSISSSISRDMMKADPKH